MSVRFAVPSGRRSRFVSGLGPAGSGSKLKALRPQRPEKSGIVAAAATFPTDRVSAKSECESTPSLKAKLSVNASAPSIAAMTDDSFDTLASAAGERHQRLASHLGPELVRRQYARNRTRPDRLADGGIRTNPDIPE